MGRRRGQRYSDRPPRVSFETKSDGKVYFSYRLPDGSKKSLGNVRTAAYATANLINARLAEASVVDPQKFLESGSARPSSRNPSMAQVIAEYETQELARKKLAAQTREQREQFLAQYKRRWADRLVQSMETLDVAKLLNATPTSSYIKHRALLIELFRFAAHSGYIKHNPAEQTLKRGEAEKVRQRHTLEGLMAIRAGSPDWLQRAIDLGLYTLQRREDVLVALRSSIDRTKGTIKVLQLKTRNYQNPVHLEIVMGGELKAAVERCLDDGVPCPYLIATRPGKLSKRIREAKSHPFAVHPDHLSRTFKAVRDSLGVYSHLEERARPTYHEIRALGIHLYTEAGYGDDYIMALSGHASKAMLERYRKDHQQSKPKLVGADLSLASLLKSAA